MTINQFRKQQKELKAYIFLAIIIKNKYYNHKRRMQFLYRLLYFIEFLIGSLPMLSNKTDLIYACF
jgi:hypothetical protein